MFYQSVNVESVSSSCIILRGYWSVAEVSSVPEHLQCVAVNPLAPNDV